jgi:hypothetical protein
VDVTLAYTQSSVTYSRTFSTLAVKGLTEPDRLHKVAILHEFLDGSLVEQVRGFRKEPLEIEFRPPFSPQETRFLTRWFLASSKLFYSGVIVSEGITDQELVSKWLFDLEYGRNFTVGFFDEVVYQRWDDGPTLDTNMYYSAIVKITGTLAAPQTFTTNVSPIAVDIWGNTFPAFSSVIHKASVIGVSAAYSQFVYCQIGEVTVSGGNLTWQAFASDFGTPADDGFYYVKFTISVQTTT